MIIKKQNNVKKILFLSFLSFFFIIIVSPVFATTYQTKATKTTTVGTAANSGGSSNSLASYANNLQAGIKTTCASYPSNFLKGYVDVNSANSACLNGLKSNTNLTTGALTNTIDAVIQHLKDSANLSGLGGGCDYHLQCVGFVEGVGIGVGSTFPKYPGASDYAKRPVPGYTFHNESSSNMKAGDIPIWEPNHIAVAIENANALGDFIVAEANGCGEGSVGSEKYPGAAPGGATYGITYLGFLRKN